MAIRTLPRLIAPALLLLAAACAPARDIPAPSPAPTEPVSATALPAPVVNGDPSFQTFVRDFQAIALAAGITAETYTLAMNGIAPVTTIQQAIDNQPEFNRPVWSYLDSAVSARRIADAKAMLARYGETLSAIESKNGVPREILVAIWGMETDYGASTGSYNLFATLATQAWQGSRRQYARNELLAALKLLQQEHYPVAQMVSSWAGAFGQTQFMPTTFFKYAADGDGDGKIDLWKSAPDALASTAVMFVREGWQTGKSWGYEVRLPKDFDVGLAEMDDAKPLSDWAAMGVETASGAALPAGPDPASLYLPAGVHGPAFLLFDNFRTIMKYNNSASYALAVGVLADRMAGGGAFVAKWPRDERALSRAERTLFQTNLKMLGYDPGEADGILGRRTRSALKQYQKAKNLPADGFPTAALLTALTNDAQSRSDSSAAR
jgi:membrane-bound lytic murein transglycosylase B